MAEQINLPGEKKKKGLSKGCLVGLIVVGVLVVMVIIAGVVCYVKKDALLKVSVVSSVTSIQTELMNNAVEGVDTVEVNRVANAFLQKLDETELDQQAYFPFIQEVQGIVRAEEIDSADARRFIQAMVDYFPELQELTAPDEGEDTTVVEDSVFGE